ncbi:L-threonylcarbamoyladenylate synthase [Gracilimonas sp.]|uniref:L-threonylcarbamoyladenylate synthase n=1 Tax=Gracilimonas sp. TaxID=1974203 RepID=UPI0028726E6D|nr:L-threonylcarbamoyladenylate synthase [Gracilimonas sp.]
MLDLNPYIRLIKSGEIVAFPTETVYGLGADAWNPSAIKKIFDAKGRPSDNPLIVHVSKKDQVKEFTTNIPEYAEILINKFWPGPITLVLNKKPHVLDALTAGLDTVALRMPDHTIALDFIEHTGPLVAPSANKSGRPSPTKAEHVKTDFGEEFLVIDGGSTEIGLESTVLDLTSKHPVILRPGKIGKDEIEQVLGTEVYVSSSDIKSPKSPGQKYTHYKPQASVFLGEIDSLEDNTLYLTQNKYANSGNCINYAGDLPLLSKELYDRFRQADIEKYEAVFIEEFSDWKKDYPSLYEALINRIRKALS